MSFGYKMKRLREMKGITTAEMGEIARVSQQTISKFESGQKVPNVIAAVLIAKRLGTTVEALVQEDD